MERSTLRAIARTIITACLLAAAMATMAQTPRTKYWTGGNGDWSDGARWSLSPDGPGGAGVPRADEHVMIAPAREAVVLLPRNAQCRDLHVSGENAPVTIVGQVRDVLEISGQWKMTGDARWDHRGTVRLNVRREGVEIDTRGIPIASEVVFDGAGAWSLASDLVLLDDRALVLKQGTVMANRSLVRAAELRFDGKAAKSFLAGDAMLMLVHLPAGPMLKAYVQPGNATWVAGGTMVKPDFGVEVGAGPMDINVCGTGPGQTPFIVDAQVVTNYNGFGVQCRGDCNATVTVTVTGGVGGFTYQWLNGGPATQTWTTACGGPQIVIVTDIGQGVSCPVSVTVSEPAPLGVIFFGGGTPPTCPDVCDGSRQALGIGGVAPITYNWNNGAGTGSSFNGLCPGANTLVVTDANGCQFDTTFVYDLQPIQPNLIFSGTSCFGACDGSASVAPQGGTPPHTVQWSPQPPIGQGTNSASGLCAGNWEVTITDFNGCDTTVQFIINEPPPLDIAVILDDASCFGACDGSVTVIPSGSPGPFTFQWTPAPGTGQGTGAAGAMCAGEYSVLIVDLSTGCDTTLQLTIDSPPAFEVDPTVTDATCSNACDGVISCPVIAGGSPPLSFNWSPNPPLGQGTPTASGLCPGLWSLTITDAAGCDTTLVFDVGAPPPLVVDPSQTDLTCYDSCDGTATAPTSGGTPPYTFVWSPTPPFGQGTDSASGLCAGLWTLTITDFNGCDTTLQFFLLEPPILEPNLTFTNVTCAGVCDGTATVDPTGGTPGYIYEWIPNPPQGQGTASVSGLCPGVWIASVTDANGCKEIRPFTIEDATPLEVDLSVQAATCPGVCDGSASASVTGGTEPYTYVWSPEPGAGQGTPGVTGLCGQNYTLTVTDALGCDTTITFTVDVPEAIEANAVITTIQCAGDCDASITLSPSGGTGIYTYDWSPQPPNGQGTATASGLCAGDWTVTIASGACDTTITFNIPEPPPLDAGLLTQDLGCAGICDGSATVDPTGGTPPYTIVWDPVPPNGQGGTSAAGLCPGNYSVTITDDEGCTLTLPFEIQGPQPIVVDLVLTDAGCDNACLGTATATVNGGQEPYAYDWQPPPPIGQGTPSVSGLCPGPYTLTVTDASGCDTTVTFIILQPSGIAAVPTVTDASCFDNCDGAIDVATNGGSPPYTFTWTPEPPVGQGTPNVSGLCPGVWTLFIADAIACDTTLLITVGAPTPIIPNESSTNESCAGPCDGTATVAPTGGDGLYTFVWAPQPPSGQGTHTASGLCPGSWGVTITDASGCDTTVTFLILEQQPIDAGLVTTDVNCHGDCDGTASVSPTGGVAPFTVLWSPEPGAGQGTQNATGLCPGAWSVTITDFAGCDTTLLFNINEPPAITLDLVTTAADCFDPCSGTATVDAAGGTGALVILWQPDPATGQGTAFATGLCAGTPYTVTITDENGCTIAQGFTIEPFDEIQPNSSSTPASCHDACDGTATVAPIGGQEPYDYVWSPEPGAGQGTSQATGLCPGVAQVTITDANGCDNVASILILAPVPLDVQATVTDLDCGGECNGGIVLDVQGGTPPYTYNWSPVPPNGQGDNVAFDLCAGTWNVTVTDANGCVAVAGFDINEPSALEVTVVITPSECQLCNGGAQLTISGGTIPILAVWTDAQGNTVAIGDNLSNACAGIYTVSVTDNNGCQEQLVVPISDSDGEVIAASATGASCHDACDGSVSVVVDCQLPPCVIVWTDANGDQIGDQPTVTDLCAGTYYATVTNTDGCVSIEAAVVTAPPPIQVMMSSSDATCAGDCDGWAFAMISGGTPPFTLNWSPEPAAGQGTPFASGLCAGTYTLTITDGAGCAASFDATIDSPELLTVNETVEGSACTGDCDGFITLEAQGGAAPYTYVWDPVPPNGQGGATATGLCAGNWSVTVIDAVGCSISLSWELGDPEPLALTTSSTQSTCPDCDGTASVAVSGGIGPYTHAWTLNGQPIGDQADLQDLCGGLYIVNVTDAAGCTVQAVVPVTDANAEVLSTNDGQVGCAGDCDGVVSVDLVCSAPACIIQWFDADGVPVGDGGTVSGLCDGDYFVVVTNADGCVSIATATVTPSTIIAPVFSSTPTSCVGACDGTATVAPSGGQEPFTYTWSPEPGGGQGTSQATGLCAGVYAVTITEGSGCDTTVTILIVDPQPLSINAFTQQADCSGACSGSVSVIVTGGQGPYDYVWDPEPSNGQGNAFAEGLCAGVVTLTVTDANGCSITQQFTITEPSPIVITASTTPSACGECIGTATASAQGGTPGYGWYWTIDDVIQGTGSSLTGLCAGLYFVTAVDAQGCSATQFVPLEDVDGETATTTDGITTCPGDCDGAVSVNVDCLDSPCDITWYDTQGNELGSGPQLGDLCAGLYLAVIANASGCITVDSAFVLSPDPILANLSTTPTSCFGDCDGTATVGPTGGAGGYIIEWVPEPPNGQGGLQATGLCAGTLEVIITDEAGCSITQGVLILSPDPISPNAVLTIATCAGDCDGSIVLSPSGGNGDFTYFWNPVPPNGQGTNSATGLCAGSYAATITDANGCTAEYTVVWNDPPTLNALVSHTDNGCFGDCQATAQVDIIGGVPGYAITWSDPLGQVIAQDVTDVSGLCAGDHQVVVTDANGCERITSFTVGQGVEILPKLTTTSETCFGPCDGSAFVAPSGGAGGPYTVLWQPEPGFGQGTAQAGELCAGTWQVIITDGAGCESITEFEILPYIGITDDAFVTHVACAGTCTGSILLATSGGLGQLDYVWSPAPPNGQGTANVTGLCAGPWSVTITDAVGCTRTFNYVILEPPPIQIGIGLITPASCANVADGAITTTPLGGTPPYTFGWTGPGGFISDLEDISGLLPGTYVLTITDANGCTETASVQVPALTVVVADAGSDQEACAGGDIILDGSGSIGATSWTWFDDQGDVVGQGAVVVLSGLPPGPHTFTLLVSDGPCNDTDEVIVVVLSLPLANAGPDQTIFVGDVVTLGGNPSGPQGSAFNWQPDSLLANNSLANPNSQPTQTTWFVLTVTAPDGCVSVDSALVTVLPTIDIPTGFTPNGDGWNDVWIIDNIDQFPECEVEIYNRWGEMLFRSVGYNTPWDGRYNGGPVPVGTYYYVIKLNDPRFPDAYTGPLTVIR